ncbi:MAG: ATP-binding protein [Saccharolobus sp.]
MKNILNMIEEAKKIASEYGEVVGLVSRVVPISHGVENNKIRAEIPHDVYLNRKFTIGTYVGIVLPVSKTTMLGRITAVERSDILAISRTPALSPIEDPTALTTPLSLTIELLSEKVENEIVPPSSPVDPQSPLFFPNKEFIKEMLGLNAEGIKIGRLVEGYKVIDAEVVLTEQMLRHHVLVVGTTGAGKTNLLKVIVSRSKIPTMVFDLQGDYVKLVASLGGNIILPITRDYVEKYKGDIIGFIKHFLRRSGLDGYNPSPKIVDGLKFTLSNGKNLFNLILLGFRFMKSYEALAEVSPIFSYQGAFYFKLTTRDCVKNNYELVIDDWIENCESMMDKSVHFGTKQNIERAIIMLKETGIIDVEADRIAYDERNSKREKIVYDEPNYEELLKGKNVLDLRFVLEKGTQASVTTAFLVIDRIFKIIDSRYKDQGKETPFLMIFDEAHEYFPQTSGRDEEKEALESLINRILRLGRVRGIGTILATHKPTDLNDLIITLTNTKIAMRADEDALRHIGMDEYADILQASPPGYGIMRTFTLRVKDLIFRTDKFE